MEKALGRKLRFSLVLGLSVAKSRSGRLGACWFLEKSWGEQERGKRLECHGEAGQEAVKTRLKPF